jgi:hypothetical protein
MASIIMFSMYMTRRFDRDIEETAKGGGVVW